ncbi:MAG: FAD-dependent oxidoreductase [Pirellulaceae bacterium]|nr:FAD-dependent oxidoreductase [Pirellulaceae bacterium]
MKIVIVGGVAGGASAATRARRINPLAEITILEKGRYISFANCGLPYHVGGEIETREKLLVATPELFWRRFRVAVKTEHEVTKIDRNGRCVHAVDLKSDSELSFPYDRLILSTGSEPNKPVANTEWPVNVSHLWTLPDMDRIIESLRSRNVRKAVVVGGGFVGLEVVEQLHRLGIEVSLVERDKQILAPHDALFARIIENHLREKGVGLKLGADLQDFTIENGLATAAVLSDGSTIETDLIVVGAGVRPRTALAVEAGLTIGQCGGVTVNSVMQTSDPNIYAVGDMVELVHGVLNEPVRIPLAGPANRAGRIAGEHAARGEATAMGKVLGTAIVRVFDLTAACTGLNEKLLAARKIPFKSAIIQAASHAGYFPGAQSMQLKIVYSPGDGKLLGAQAVGGEGVDKRIDVIATAIHFGATVWQLAELDLAYAPPYGSAKDPVHMAAFAACNDLSQFPNLVAPDSVLNGMQIVDVRTAKERAALPLPNAIAIEIDDFPERWQELDRSKPTVVVCHSGKRAHIGACWLRGQGFRDVSNLTGGMAIRSLISKS